MISKLNGSTILHVSRQAGNNYHEEQLTNEMFIVNIVFEEDSEAQETLSKLSTTEVTNIQEERPIKSMAGQKDQELTARISNTGDKKVKNAAQYSRYYLFNPQEEKKYRKRDNYRERQPVRRRRSNVDEELFPSKASEFITPDEDLINRDNEDEKKDDQEDLFSRIGTKSDLGSRVGDSDKLKNQKTYKGDLDSRISSNDDSGDLFSRIGDINSNAPE